MTHLRRSRGWLWLLLAAALFMRAALPQGFMAERDDTGAIAVKVCGAGHVLQIPLEKDGPQDDDPAQPPCAFAGLGTPALPPSAIAELPVPALATAQFPHTDTAAARFAVPWSHPPARGPPFTA